MHPLHRLHVDHGSKLTRIRDRHWSDGNPFHCRPFLLLFVQSWNGVFWLLEYATTVWSLIIVFLAQKSSSSASRGNCQNAPNILANSYIPQLFWNACKQVCDSRGMRKGCPSTSCSATACCLPSGLSASTNSCAGMHTNAAALFQYLVLLYVPFSISHKCLQVGTLLDFGLGCVFDMGWPHICGPRSMQLLHCPCGSGV